MTTAKKQGEGISNIQENKTPTEQKEKEVVVENKIKTELVKSEVGVLKC